MHSLISPDYRLTDVALFLQEGEMTKEQIEEEIRRIKDAHAEDEGTFSSLVVQSGVIWIDY